MNQVFYLVDIFSKITHDELFYCLLISGLSGETRPRGYKTFFVLNSVEHEILNAHKYKDIKKFSFL